MYSQASQLPGALSAVNVVEQPILDVAGQEGEQALGAPRGGRRRVETGRPAAGQSCRCRSMATVCLSAVGVAPISDSVLVLKSITSGWSISYTVVSDGHPSR